MVLIKIRLIIILSNGAGKDSLSSVKAFFIVSAIWVFFQVLIYVLWVISKIMTGTNFFHYFIVNMNVHMRSVGPHRVTAWSVANGEATLDSDISIV
jgi:hypothetical protein